MKSAAGIDAFLADPKLARATTRNKAFSRIFPLGKGFTLVRPARGRTSDARGVTSEVQARRVAVSGAVAASTYGELLNALRPKWLRAA